MDALIAAIRQWREEKKEKLLERKIRKYHVRKLTVLFILILLLFVVIAVNLVRINIVDGTKYEQQVLSQQKYDSNTIPYKRGAILDRNGTALAYSEMVYNVILDAKVMNDKNSKEKIEPTLSALNQSFGFNTVEIRNYISQNAESSYYTLAKQLTYNEIQPYIEMRDAEGSMINKNAVWFEEQYRRVYPYDSLACDVIGFAMEDGSGYGLEQYYDSELCGDNGREFGYLNDDNSLERTIIPAANGYTLVSTIDSYIQRVCEENIIAYNQEHANEYREGEDGSDNTGVIVMDVNTGEVLAMASYPLYNLNDKYNLEPYYTAEEIAQLEAENKTMDALNSIWKNFCISESYEPGSVCKTFTVATGLDLGVVKDEDIYDCGGYLTFGEGNHATTIRCHQRFGDGPITTKQAVEKSCNVALMLMGQKIGAKNYLRYFRNFNFGLKTNIDLTGEMRTDSLVFTEESMGVTELATSTFGQGYNVTMIQTISAYCSLVNGGYYYKPHMVSQILDDSGAVVQNIEPEMLRQTVSETVSERMRDYCIGVVEEGTGTYARPYGYRIGGKTGTAEHSGAGKIDYVISFMGFAPADDPQIAIYVVIDRPNTATQDNATRSACKLCRAILTDILPYLNIYMTEDLTEEERAELQLHKDTILEEMQQQLDQNNWSDGVSGNSVSADSISGNEVSENNISVNSVIDEVISIDDINKNGTIQNNGNSKIVIDPATGYAIDPLNGEFLDPVTGEPINQDSSIFQYGTANEADNTETE